MTAYTKGLNQEATYWAPGVNDGYGGVAYTVAPVLVQVRWQPKIDTVRNNQGEVFVSNTVVYSSIALAPRGYIVIGDYTDDVDSDGLSDPKDVEGSREVMVVAESPSIDATQTLHKAWL